MPKIWDAPHELHEAADTLENISASIQFIKDLVSQPTPSPQSTQYDFSEQGYFGLYLFMSFIQDRVEECQKVIIENQTERRV